MASDELRAEYLTAGQEYLAAVSALGLRPEGLAWARVDHLSENLDDLSSPHHSPGDAWHLVVITSLIDEAGPLAIESVLFEAYNKSATPKLIDPFIVQVMSAKTGFAQEVLNAFARPSVSVIGYDEFGKQVDVDTGERQYLVRGLWMEQGWVYFINPAKPVGFKDRRRQWLNFRQNVHAIAA